MAPRPYSGSRRLVNKGWKYVATVSRTPHAWRQTFLSLSPRDMTPESTQNPAAALSRSMSSHRKAGHCGGAMDNASEGESSWSSRWKRHRRERHEAFIRHVEEDPYHALFGASNHWLGWLKNTYRSPNPSGWPTQRYHVHEARPEHSSASTVSARAPDSRYPKSNPNSQETTSEPITDYDIDPITLRKIPRQRSTPPSIKGSIVDTADEEVNIPVKRYRTTDTKHDPAAACGIPTSQADEPAQHPQRHWLAREGFQTAQDEPRATKTPVESALDRQIAKETRAPRLDRQDGTKRDDVDLLRTADVRAASGLRGRVPKEDAVDREHRQNALERRFDEIAVELDGKFTKESESGLDKRDKDLSIRSQIKEQYTENTPSNTTQVKANHAQLTSLKDRIDTLSDDYTVLKKKTQKAKDRLEEIRKTRATDRARDLLASEIKRQQEAMQAMAGDGSRGSSAGKQETALLQSPLPGEGDVASNIHEFANRSRWYKQKAPHAKCEMDAKMQQLARDNALVREVRGIYEDAYGAIDTSHRQSKRLEQSRKTLDPKNEIVAKSQTRPSGGMKGPIQTYLENNERCKDSSEEIQQFATNMDEALRQLRGSSPSAAESVIRAATSLLDSLSAVKERTTALDPELSGGLPPILYRILAFDASSQRVISAKMEVPPESADSCLSVDGAVTPVDALKHLDNPGKFLPHITTLQSKGYDITSASKDLLVLKKNRLEKEGPVRYHGRPNPVDGTTTPEISAGNFASPTGYVSYSPLIPPEEEGVGEQAESNKKVVRRQEPVFSGTSSTGASESRRRSRSQRRKTKKMQTLKRMFWTGTLTASACYAVGAILESTQH